MTQPAVTACACTGEPESILDEAGQPMLVEGVVVCPRCGHNPFGVRACTCGVDRSKGQRCVWPVCAPSGWTMLKGSKE